LPSTQTFLLPSPWALFDTSAEMTGYGRLRLDRNSPTEVIAGRPIYIAVPTESEVWVSGYKMAAHRLGSTFRWGENDYALHLLSVGVRPNENSLEIEVDGEFAGIVTCQGYIPRPAFSAGRENAEIPQLRAEILDGFLLSIVNLIQMTSDPQYDKYQLVWDRLQEAWSDLETESTIPPMALIVRHAQRFASMVRDLTEKPRHLLRRQTELTAVDRVQQLDVACVRWLSRQPGENVYEQAGGRQKIMAVQRHESIDTLENRVLRDFSLRTSREASRYTNLYGSLSETARWNMVHRYGRRCHRAVSELVDRGVSNLAPPVVPNFVLLQDQRYRYLWEAYLELIRRQDEADECWRWQHRLWLDYLRLVIHQSIRSSENFELIAEEPLRITDEQVRGVWSRIPSQSGSWLFVDDIGEEYVVSLIWNAEIDHPKSENWILGLGCSAYLHVTRLSDQAEAYILIWGYHAFLDEPENLGEIAASCDRALNQVREYRHFIDDEAPRVGGMVFVSDAYKGTTQRGVLLEKTLTRFDRTGRVAVIRLRVSRREIASVSKRIKRLVPTFINDLFAED
jgi:hypothetical protein